MMGMLRAQPQVKAPGVMENGDFSQQFKTIKPAGLRFSPPSYFVRG
jgi:hypothetical protein